MSNSFLRVAQITLLLVFLVILAGSVVRATGAGMGCPDWPKCFGTWVPPTDASQLPSDYKTRYAGEHNAVEEFNAAKTWTEYINRLLGALLGVAVFIQLIMAFKHRKKDKTLFGVSLFMFLLVGFQGWLGARVVASNLAPIKITTHMVAALIILAMGVWIVFRLQYRYKDLNLKCSISPLLLWSVLLLTFVQIMLGTQVRESVDIILDRFARSQVIEQIGSTFYVHRSLAWLVLILNGWVVYQLMQTNASTIIKNTALLLIVLVFAEVLTGIILNWFSFPAVTQPIHLLLACVLFSVQIMLLLHQRNTQNSQSLTV